MRRRPAPAEALLDHVLLDHLRLIRTEGVGPQAYRRLLARYGSAAAALEALPRLARAGGRPAPPAIPSREIAADECDRLARLGGRFLLLGTADYPPLLALLPDAPPLLACLGDPAILATRAVALVGGRNATANGVVVAETLAADLAQVGITVISGLARGIDAAAHTGALATGRTVAVVAGGLDCPYPAEHAALQARIATAGAVVAEAALGTSPQARHFPRRNRIIAGLALGVVVIEAALRSGSLITANLAQDAGREIFAVPGSSLDPRARGSNDEPGTAKISRPASCARFAVIRLPERSAASITTTPSAKPAMMRLRRGKCRACGDVPSAASATTAPAVAMRACSAACSAGYGQSRPPATTATVRPVASAPVWAAASIPRASPEITVMPTWARSAANVSATTTPLAVAFRPPTSATARVARIAGSPRQASSGGASGSSASKGG